MSNNVGNFGDSADEQLRRRLESVPLPNYTESSKPSMEKAPEVSSGDSDVSSGGTGISSGDSAAAPAEQNQHVGSSFDAFLKEGIEDEVNARVVSRASDAPVAAQPQEAISLIREFVDAMKRYAMDVDDAPPYRHTLMVERAEKFLQTAQAQPQEPQCLIHFANPKPSKTAYVGKAAAFWDRRQGADVDCDTQETGQVPKLNSIGLAESWCVTVEANGERILSISNQHYAGRPELESYEATIENCAQHLLSFIGAQAAPAQEGGSK